MTESFSTNATLLGLNATFGYVKKIATNSISLNSSIAPFTFSTSGFGYIEAGSSILLTPTNANSQGFYAPEGSVVLIRISDVSATCDPLFSKPSYAKQNAVGDKDNVGETGNIRLFPNPFSKTFTIDILSKEATAAQVNIYNEIGILMKANKTTNLTKGRNQLTVDGSIFSPGMYMVEIITGNAKTVRKVVKF